jgi:hypothetical protein
MRYGTPEDLAEELRQIKKETNEPETEAIEIPIVESKATRNAETPQQFKLNIPKKYAQALQLGKSTHRALVRLIKTPQEKIIIEITKK